MLAANWGCSPHFMQRGEIGLWRSRSSMRRTKYREDLTLKLKDGHRYRVSLGRAMRCPVSSRPSRFLGRGRRWSATVQFQVLE
jgi:hypothetical protein